MRRSPDFVIGDPRAPYLRRWWIIPRNRFFNVYLHEILRSDDDQALHDHPWWNISIILKGGYWEHMPYFNDPATLHIKRIEGKCVWKVWRNPGEFIFRRASAAHRLELAEERVPIFKPMPENGMRVPQTVTCWSLFITGPRIRDWGFHCPRGWIHWRDFIGVKTGEATGSEKGPGCGE